VGAAAAERIRRGRTHGSARACPARHPEGARMTKLLVVHGPNLNLIGKRELKTDVAVFQSNIEGELIDFLQKEGPGADGIVINPGALSHYSLALYDCLQALRIPVVEVHISNIHAREEFRSRSVTARAARGVIAGLGFDGYLHAMEFLIDQHE